jgi:hypothetical protein
MYNIQSTNETLTDIISEHELDQLFASYGLNRPKRISTEIRNVMELLQGNASNLPDNQERHITT